MPLDEVGAGMVLLEISSRQRRASLVFSFSRMCVCRDPAADAVASTDEVFLTSFVMKVHVAGNE